MWLPEEWIIRSIRVRVGINFRRLQRHGTEDMLNAKSLKILTYLVENSSSPRAVFGGEILISIALVRSENHLGKVSARSDLLKYDFHKIKIKN